MLTHIHTCGYHHQEDKQHLDFFCPNVSSLTPLSGLSTGQGVVSITAVAVNKNRSKTIIRVF